MRDFLKNFILATVLILSVHQKSYAVISADVYGGYAFSGTLNGEKAKGPVRGMSVHYNGSFLPTLKIGIGGFYQISELEYEMNEEDCEALRKTLGLDLNLTADLPLFRPYGRFTWGVVDTFKDEGKKRDIEMFKAWGAALGLQVSVVPFFSVYGEYRIDRADHGADLGTDSAIMGLKFNF